MCQGCRGGASAERGSFRSVVVRQVSSDHRLTIATVAIDPAITVSTPLLRSALLELASVVQTIPKDRLLGDETVTPSSTRFDKRRLRSPDALAAHLAGRLWPGPALPVDATLGRDPALDLGLAGEQPDSPRHVLSAGSRDDHASTDDTPRRWDPQPPSTRTLPRSAVARLAAAGTGSGPHRGGRRRTVFHPLTTTARSPTDRWRRQGSTRLLPQFTSGGLAGG